MEKNFSELKVSDVMTNEPVTVSASATIEQCAKIMTERKIGSIIIEDEIIEGLITEQDLVRKVLAMGLDPKVVLAKEIMVKKLITIAPDQSIQDAVDLMAKNQIRHLPVVSTKDLEGFITAKDLLQIEPMLFNDLISCFKIINKND